MNRHIINIGIVSKGRLKEESEKILKKNNLKIYSEGGERGLVAKVKGRKNIRILFLHAREIIDQLSHNNQAEIAINITIKIWIKTDLIIFPI